MPTTRAVTSIVQLTGAAEGAQPTKTVVSTHEMVPFREELFTAAQVGNPSDIASALQKVGRHIAEATQAVRSLPLLGGNYFPNLPFVAGSPLTIAHLIPGGKTVSWMVCRPRAWCRIYEMSQNTSRGTILLQTDANCVLDLWFFVAPGSL